MEIKSLKKAGIINIMKGWDVKEVLISEGVPGIDPRGLRSCCQLVLVGYFT